MLFSDFGISFPSIKLPAGILAPPTTTAVSQPASSTASTPVQANLLAMTMPNLKPLPPQPAATLSVPTSVLNSMMPNSPPMPPTPTSLPTPASQIAAMNAFNATVPPLVPIDASQVPPLVPIPVPAPQTALQAVMAGASSTLGIAGIVLVGGGAFLYSKDQKLAAISAGLVGLFLLFQPALTMASTAMTMAPGGGGHGGGKRSGMHKKSGGAHVMHPSVQAGPATVPNTVNATNPVQAASLQGWY